MKSSLGPLKIGSRKIPLDVQLHGHSFLELTGHWVAVLHAYLQPLVDKCGSLICGQAGLSYGYRKLRILGGFYQNLEITARSYLFL